MDYAFLSDIKQFFYIFSWQNGTRNKHLPAGSLFAPRLVGALCVAAEDDEDIPSVVKLQVALARNNDE